MRFFVPSVNDSRQAEELYHQLRDKVTASGEAISDKRIYRLKYRQEGHPETLVVGSDRHNFGGGPIVAIFEGANGTHYICTQRASAADAEAHPLPSSAIVEEENFSAMA